MEEGREVFAVPGEITSTLSAGTNALLRAGATPLCAVADVLEALGLEAAASASVDDPLLELLPATADELARATGRDAAQLAARLVELELEGAVTAAEGIYRKGV
jgi:DNA processing protein